MGSQCKFPALGPFLKHSQAFVSSLEEKSDKLHYLETLAALLLAGMLFEGQNLNLVRLYLCMCNRRETQLGFVLILIIFLSTNNPLRLLSQRNSLEYISLNRNRNFHQHQQPPLEKISFIFLPSPHPCVFNHFVIQSPFESRRLSYYCSDELYSTLKIFLCLVTTTGPMLLHCPGCYNWFGQAQVDP